MMLQSLVLSLALLLSADAFLSPPTRSASPVLFAAAGKDNLELAKAFSVGSLIEFQEKKRSHLGKITQVEHKSNGAARYHVEEYPSGKTFSIPDKDVSFAVPPRTNVNQEEKLLEQLEHAFILTGNDLCNELDISPELLAMAWEEALHAGDDANDAATETAASAALTPTDLVELVHSHSADHGERYAAWRLLRSEIGHVFFKELKQQGRVVSFKPKKPKAMETAKDQFCNAAAGDDFGGTDNDLCDVEGLAP